LKYGIFDSKYYIGIENKGKMFKQFENMVNIYLTRKQKTRNMLTKKERYFKILKINQV